MAQLRHEFREKLERDVASRMPDIKRRITLRLKEWASSRLTSTVAVRLEEMAKVDTALRPMLEQRIIDWLKSEKISGSFAGVLLVVEITPLPTLHRQNATVGQQRTPAIRLKRPVPTPPTPSTHPATSNP